MDRNTKVYTRENFDLTSDYEFHYLMMDVTCIEFLIAMVLDRDVEPVTILDSTTGRNRPDQKQYVYDSLIKTSRNEVIDIEMQNKNEIGFCARLIAYLSAIIHLIAEKGSRYEYPKALVIAFIKFHLRKNKESSDITYRFSDGEALTNDTRIIPIELVDLKELMKKPVEDLTTLEAFRIYLRYSHELKHRAYIDDILQKEGGISYMEERVQTIIQDPYGFLDFKHRLDERVRKRKEEEQAQKIKEMRAKARNAQIEAKAAKLEIKTVKAEANNKITKMISLLKKGMSLDDVIKETDIEL